MTLLVVVANAPNFQPLFPIEHLLRITLCLSNKILLSKPKHQLYLMEYSWWCWSGLGTINIYLLSFLSPTDSSVVESRASAAVMFRNSLKMLLTGGKANRKSRSSGESVLWCQPQTMTHLPVNTQKVLASSVCVFLGSEHMQAQRMKHILNLLLIKIPEVFSDFKNNTVIRF